jgi:hypothetical protein
LASVETPYLHRGADRNTTGAVRLPNREDSMSGGASEAREDKGGNGDDESDRGEGEWASHVCQSVQQRGVFEP